MNPGNNVFTNEGSAERQEIKIVRAVKLNTRRFHEENLNIIFLYFTRPAFLLFHKGNDDNNDDKIIIRFFRIMASRFEELTKQPEAKWIKIYNQGDKFDHKAHNILVSPRNVKDFDHFVDEVNDKLKPPGVPLRKIYTSKGGTEVKSLSDLTPNKEYMASPSKFKKKKKKKTSTDQGSASSDKGYHSSDETRKEPNSHPCYG